MISRTSGRSTISFQAMCAIRTPSWLGLRRAEPVQRIDISGMPGEEGKPIFMVYRHEDIAADVAR